MNEQEDSASLIRTNLELASDLFDHGASIQEVEAQLVERGVPRSDLEDLINKSLEKWFVRAIVLLHQGESRDSISWTLAREGLHPDLASLLAVRVGAEDEAGTDMDLGTRILIRAVGFLFFVAGLGLVIGNRTGAFVTFPFAGFLVILFGAMISSTAKSR